MISGTSFDGIDVAIGDFQRHDDVVTLRTVGHAEYPYPEELSEAIASMLPPASTTIGEVCRVDTLIGQAFAEAAARGVAELGDGECPDLISSHGQTVFHWVDGGRAYGTLQLGQPAWIAERTGAPVLSDLRSRDIAKGGQGAPLVPIFDHLLLPPADRAKAALNIGGIANMTVIPGRDTDGEVFAYDLGPGNALIDLVARQYFDRSRDDGGNYASNGTVDAALLESLSTDPYFDAPAPKSTGKELFHAGYLADRLRTRPELSPYDVIATVTELTARVVAAECRKHQISEVIASGGGVRNHVLMRRIRALTAPDTVVSTIDDVGIPSDAKEAYAFAVMGYLTVHGMPVTMTGCTGAREGARVGSLTPGATPLRFPDPWQTEPTVLRVETRGTRA